MSGPVIDTARFTLRPLADADVTPRYLSWFDDEAARKYIAAAAHTTALDDLRAYVAERRDRDDVLFLGIFDRASGLHIGNVQYNPVDTARGYAVFGVLIGDAEFRGRGVTPEILKATAAWLQAHRGIRQIVLGVHRENTPAIEAYRRAGFVTAPTPFIPVPAEGATTMVWELDPR